jgi:hypothetical protein
MCVEDLSMFLTNKNKRAISLSYFRWLFLYKEEKTIYFESKLYLLHKYCTAHNCLRLCPFIADGIETQGADPLPPSSKVAKAGRNHLNEQIAPLLPTGIGERYSQIISNLGHAALLRRLARHWQLTEVILVFRKGMRSCFVNNVNLPVISFSFNIFF